jgi:hypothetical protein
MKKILSLTLLGGLLLLGSATLAPASTGAFTTQFCPQCWEYLFGAGSLDMRGNCGVCGKYPVEIEAQQVSWWWCSLGKKWRRAPSPENWMRSCCTQEESLAMVSAPGPQVVEAWYCPAHRQFYVARIPIVMQTVCRICARPAVRVETRERAWYWCENDGVWGGTPCPLDPVRHCCAKREGTLLVRLEPGPIAK